MRKDESVVTNSAENNQQLSDGAAPSAAKLEKLEQKAPFAGTENHPILREDESRFCVFPLTEPDLWRKYKQAVACFWTVEEVEFGAEDKRFDLLTAGEQHFIKTVLAFFAHSDGIVNENLVQNLFNEVQLPEARAFYAFQIAMETVHEEMYSLLIETYVKDSEEKNKMFNALDNYPCIRKKADWALKWMNNKTCSFAQRICAFSIVEGVFFSGSFAAIFWLKTRTNLHGLTFSNELISRDEGMHTEFACMLFRKLVPKPTAEESRLIVAMMEEAVAIESEFFSDALPVSLIGMNVKLMCEYIRFVADRLLEDLVDTRHFGATNPFDFMENISMQGKTNFFERRVGEYQKMGVKEGRRDDDFKLDANF